MRAPAEFARRWRQVLVGLAVGAAVGALVGWTAALFVPEEFSRTGFVELVLIMAGVGAAAGLIQKWLS